MRNRVRIGACQTPEIIGDPPAALACMLRFAKEAEAKNVELLLFPECFLTGYILDETYVANNSFDLGSWQFAAIRRQLEHVKPMLVFGLCEQQSGRYFNSAVVMKRGEIIGVYRKTHLIDPNEACFSPGDEYPIFEANGLRFGINICYDARFPEAAKAVADQGAQLLLLPAQNMLRRETAEFWKDKHNEIRSARVLETGLWFVSSDVTGVRPAGQYGVERVGYGPTLAMNPRAEVVARVAMMTEGMIVVDVPVGT